MDSSNDCEMMPVSFADILKNSQPRRRYKSECVQRTWLEQIEEFEQQELMVMNGFFRPNFKINYKKGIIISLLSGTVYFVVKHPQQ